MYNAMFSAKRLRVRYPLESRSGVEQPQVMLPDFVSNPITNGIKFYIPGSPRNIPLVVSLSYMEVENGKRSRYEVGACAASILACLMPSLSDAIMQKLQAQGVHLVKTKLPSQAETLDYLECFMIFAQVAMFLFINVHSLKDFEGFFTEKLSLLRRKAGLEQVSGKDPLFVFSRDTAERVHSFLGSISNFRVIVLKHLIAISSSNQQNPSTFSNVCEYSSYLLHSYAVNEVKNLNEALDVVSRFEYPQFFGVLGPQSDQRKVDQNRFPFLFSVAYHKCKDTYPYQVMLPCADAADDDDDIYDDLYM
ncbi:hypothetical protein ACFE04_014472 [Oxalis oulophora]